MESNARFKQMTWNTDLLKCMAERVIDAFALSSACCARKCESKCKVTEYRFGYFSNREDKYSKNVG